MRMVPSHVTHYGKGFEGARLGMETDMSPRANASLDSPTLASRSAIFWLCYAGGGEASTS